MTASEPSPVLHVPKTIETAKLLGLTKQEEEEMRNQLKRNALGRCHDKVLGKLIRTMSCVLTFF